MNRLIRIFLIHISLISRTSTHVTGSTGTRRLFAVDFQGDGLARPEEIEVALSASAGTITRQDRFHYPERRTLRVLFELDPGSERASELRLVLKRGDRPVSETWLYRWTP